MTSQEKLWQAVRIGLIAGVVALSVCLIGLVESFNKRDIVSEQLTLGQLLLFSTAVVAAYLTAKPHQDTLAKFIHGILSGVTAAIPVFLLILLSLSWETIRDSFINVSPDLLSIITLGSESPVSGGLQLIGVFAIVALFGIVLAVLSKPIRSALLTGFGWTIGLGMMAELLNGILRSRLSKETLDILFGKSGINLTPTIILLLGITVSSYWWKRAGSEQFETVRQNLSPQQLTWSSRVWRAFIIFAVLILPSILGVYLTEIINNVGLYILMGLGLNIAIGLAGLLDLGYVTNFAVGAYLMALLTSSSDFGLASPISFWIALPICVLAAMFTGFFFALPVLRMRGDYLAIATLGFGEIVRVLARSDALKSIIGGAQGILQIPQAQISGPIAGTFGVVLNPINNFLGNYDLGILATDEGAIIFNNPPQLYYLLVLACLLMLFISRRLNDSSTGRRWMAMREDEDVAAAMGINTTNAKVIAFTLSAASGGLAGAIFAAKLGSIYPNSFQLLISVNVLSLIIVGGLGSIPGVVVGAFALVGIPELLREFAEFRLLFYGIALIAMMLVRPEGLWPSEANKRELHRDDNEPIPDKRYEIGDAKYEQAPT